MASLVRGAGRLRWRSTTEMEVNLSERMHPLCSEPGAPAASPLRVPPPSGALSPRSPMPPGASRWQLHPETARNPVHFVPGTRFLVFDFGLGCQWWALIPALSAIALAPVSYTHLTLPTICSV
eukprot:2138998-Rhodomonas_salina.1